MRTTIYWKEHGNDRKKQLPAAWARFIQGGGSYFSLRNLMRGTPSHPIDATLQNRIVKLTRRGANCNWVVDVCEGASGYGSFHLCAALRHGKVVVAEVHTIIGIDGTLIAEFILEAARSELMPQGV